MVESMFRRGRNLFFDSRRKSSYINYLSFLVERYKKDVIVLDSVILTCSLAFESLPVLSQPLGLCHPSVVVSKDLSLFYLGCEPKS